MVIFVVFFPPLVLPVCQKVEAETAQAHPCFSNGGYLFYFLGDTQKLNDNDHLKGHGY